MVKIAPLAAKNLVVTPHGPNVARATGLFVGWSNLLHTQFDPNGSISEYHRFPSFAASTATRSTSLVRFCPTPPNAAHVWRSATALD